LRHETTYPANVHPEGDDLNERRAVDRAHDALGDPLEQVLVQTKECVLEREVLLVIAVQVPVQDEHQRMGKRLVDRVEDDRHLAGELVPARRAIHELAEEAVHARGVGLCVVLRAGRVGHDEGTHIRA
jgi:hypothetical protein